MLTGFDLCRAAMDVDGITAPEANVLMVLAIMANGEAQCWPPINGDTGLTARTKLSERAVQRAIQRLVELGHITRRQLRNGVIYTIHPANDPTPVTETGVSVAGVSQSPRGDCVAPKQPVTTITSDANASSVAPEPAPAAVLPVVEKVKRATRLPDNFEPILTAEAQRIVDGWPPGMFEREQAQWRDHHAAKGMPAKDWQASLRTWIRNAEKYRNRDNVRHRPANDRDGHRNPMVRAGLAREAQFAGRSDQ